MSKKINIPKYVKKLIHKNPSIVSGRKNFFEHHKKRKTGTSSLDEDNRQQRMIYYSSDFYWLQPLDEIWHGTLGMREDRIENKLIQFGDDSASSDFHLWTLQF